MVAVSRHTSTTASGGKGPEVISSQPTRRRPRAASQSAIRLVNQACSSSSLASPSLRISAWQSAHAFQRSFGTSSPPTCT
jgi:hypothetical protein